MYGPLCFYRCGLCSGYYTVVILYENDVHCAVEGYSKLAAMKKELLETHTCKHID